MAKVADIGSKRLISLAPASWVRWLLGEKELPQVELVGNEFHWVSRTEDMLLKVHSAEHGVFLIANEIQLRPHRRMAQRMRAVCRSGWRTVRFACIADCGEHLAWSRADS